MEYGWWDLLSQNLLQPHFMISGHNIRMGPYFKVFEDQPCAGRSQWAEYKDIMFFEIEKCSPLPLGNLRKIFLHVIEPKNIYIFKYRIIITNENRLEAKVNIVQCLKTFCKYLKYSLIKKSKKLMAISQPVASEGGSRNLKVTKIYSKCSEMLCD